MADARAPEREAAGRDPAVLATRLLPPRPPPGRVPRPRLAARVADGLEGRVVALVAGAGYGKTTLLVECLEGGRLPWVWVSCDPRLEVPERLFAHLLAALGRRFPGVGAGLPPPGDPEERVTALANELLETVPDEFVIALDDVHALGDGAAAVMVRQLMSDLPANVHFAVASRRALGPLPSRVRASGVTVIAEQELAFTLAEAEALLGAGDGPLDEADVGEIHRRTEGWAAGLLLARQAAGAPQHDESLVGGPHFDYLAEEVLATLEPATRRFLTETSILERFTPELATAVTGEERAADLIDSLVRGHLFTVPLDERGEWFRYHHLFRDLLERMLAEATPPAQVRELHRRAGRAFAVAGLYDEAARHHLLGEDHEAAADSLLALSEQTGWARPDPALIELLAQVPARDWERHPHLRLASALVRFLGGERVVALGEWGIAIDALVERGDHEEAVNALFVSQQAMLTCGLRPELRVRAGEPYLERLQDAGTRLSLVEFQIGVAHAVAAHEEEAERWFAAAARRGGPGELALIVPTTELMRSLYFDLPAGRIGTALGRIEPSLERLRPIEVPESLMVQAYGLGFRAAILADTGRYRECLAERAAVLEVSAAVGMREAPGLVNLWWQLTCLSGMGDWSTLATLVDDAERVVARGADTNVEYRYPAALARLDAATGFPQRALVRVAAAREALARYGDAYESPMILIEAAHAAVAAGDRELGIALAEEARETAAARGAGWYRARAALVAAWAEGGGPRAQERVAEAVALSTTGDLELLWTHRERPIAAPVLAAGLELGPVARRAAELAAACGGEVLSEVVERVGSASGRELLARVVDEQTDVEPEAVRALEADTREEVKAAAGDLRRRLEARARQPLRISTFGGLRVLRGSRLLTDADFGRPKARVLLAALVCAGASGLARDRVLDLLWPELTPDRGVRAFDTTLHALRRTLEPWASPRAGGSVIGRVGDLYRLEPGPQDRLDLAEIRDLMEAARRARDDAAIAHLSRAEELSRGEFLPEHPYEDWAREARESLAATRVELLALLAERLLEAGRPVAAIERYRELLAMEPETEAWHRALMRGYDLAGERGKALRQFHACRTVLRTALGTEPSAETTALYVSLL